MRTVKDKSLIKTAIRRSQGKREQLILQSRRKREFFKFEDGSIVEYDCTKYKYKQVTLTNEEKEAIKSFNFTAPSI